MKTISVNPETQSYELSIRLPFVNKTTQDYQRRTHALTCIKFGKVLLLKALEARMEACYTNLQSHLNDVIYCDQFQITYKKSDSTPHSFNIKSYHAMEECREVFLTMETHLIYAKLQENPQWAEQLCKALYWVKPEDRESLHFDDLISSLMDIAMYGPKKPI